MTNTVTLKPIGNIQSAFHNKKETPNPLSPCPAAKAILTIDKSVYNNPEHSLDGLQEYSHVWLIFCYRKRNASRKAKVKSPHGNGISKGVFSTRFPYGPNNIGLSLAKVDEIKGPSVHLSGINILDGTPVLDIKPYIHEYDTPYAINNEHETIPSSKEQDVKSNHSNASFTILDEVDADLNENSHQNCVDRSELNNKLQNSNAISDSNDICSTPDSIKKERIKHLEGEWEREQIKNHSPQPNNQEAKDFQHSSSVLDPIDIRLSPQFPDSVGDNEARAIKDNETINCEDCMIPHELYDDPKFPEDVLSDASDDNFVDFLVGDVLAKAASQLQPSFLDLESEHLLSLTNNSATSNSDESPVQNAYGKQSKEKRKSSQEGRETIKSYSNESKSPVSSPGSRTSLKVKSKIIYKPEALEQLSTFTRDSMDKRFRLKLLRTQEEAQIAISNILQEEPQSVSRCHHCAESPLCFTIDILHVTCRFDKDDIVRILGIKSVKNIH